MELDKRIPVLVKVQNEIDFGSNSFEEPDITRCYNCGGNLFYIGKYYGLVKKPIEWVHTLNVIGETKESKKYRQFEVDFIEHSFKCAQCGESEGSVSIYNKREVIRRFEDTWEKDEYEIAIDLIKYPENVTVAKKRRYKNRIDKIHKWIEEHENEVRELKKHEKELKKPKKDK